MFRTVALVITACAAAACAAAPADLPAGYELVYQQEFEQASAINDFVFTDPAAYRIGSDAGNHYLELHTQSKYKPPHRSPVNIALLATKQVGDFVLEADLMQTSREYGHRDMCVFFNVQDPAHFYYVHIATKSDPNAHQIMIVNDAPRKFITTEGTPGYDWGRGDWHKLRLVRNAGEGKIAVYMNDMAKPIMVTSDKHFGMGWLGFGSFDDTGRIDNVKVYAPKSTDKKPEFFKAAK